MLEIYFYGNRLNTDFCIRAVGIATIKSFRLITATPDKNRKKLNKLEEI